MEITTKLPPIPFSIAAYLKAYPGRPSPSLPRQSSLRPHPISWLNGNEASPLQSITGAGLDLHWPQSRIRHSFVVTIFGISMGYFIVYVHSACEYARRIYEQPVYFRLLCLLSILRMTGHDFRFVPYMYIYRILFNDQSICPPGWHCSF